MDSHGDRLHRPVSGGTAVLGISPICGCELVCGSGFSRDFFAIIAAEAAPTTGSAKGEQICQS